MATRNQPVPQGTTDPASAAAPTSAELSALLDDNDELRAKNEQLQAQLSSAPPPEQLAELLRKIKELEERDAGREMPQADVSLDAIRATLGESCDESNASTKARWRVVVARAPDSREGNEIKIGVNGRIYQVQRGVPVDLPPEAVLALADAVLSTAIRNADDQITGWHDAPRIPFQVLGMSVDASGRKLMP